MMTLLSELGAIAVLNLAVYLSRRRDRIAADMAGDAEADRFIHDIWHDPRPAPVVTDSRPMYRDKPRPLTAPERQRWLEAKAHHDVEDQYGQVAGLFSSWGWAELPSFTEVR